MGCGCGKKSMTAMTSAQAEAIVNGASSSGATSQAAVDNAIANAGGVSSTPEPQPAGV